MSKHFYDKGEYELGIRLAEAQTKSNPANPFLRVRLSHMYRDASQPEVSVEVFRDAPEETKRDRAFYYEWGTAEGHAGNRMLGAWLDAVSLADGIEGTPPDNNRAKLSLGGIGEAFENLHKQYNELIFIEACAASAQLGLKLALDETAKKFFMDHKMAGVASGVDIVDDKLAIKRVVTGVSKAWEIGGDGLPSYVPRPASLSFKGLKYLLKIREA